MKTIEEVRDFFAKDRYATESGAVIDEISDHAAVCSLKITEMHRNAMGGVMGGVYFTLADFAFAVASNWQEAGVVSLSSNITYLAAAKGERLIARAGCIKDGRNTNYYRVDITDEQDVLLAVVNITGYKVK